MYSSRLCSYHSKKLVRTSTGKNPPEIRLVVGRSSLHLNRRCVFSQKETNKKRVCTHRTITFIEKWLVVWIESNKLRE